MTSIALTMSSGSVLGLVLGVLVFVAILGGFWYLSKRISKGSVFSGRRIKVIERLMVTKESSVLLLQIGLRLLVVGAGRDGVTLLFELSPADFDDTQKKPDEYKQGFWGRFGKNMKANLTGTQPQTGEDDSFAELLRKMTEASAAANEPAPPPQGWEQSAAPKRSGYQVEIDNMSRLSQPDALDRRARTENPFTPSRRPEPTVRQPSAARPAPENDKERAERIDQLLDLVSQRQARLDDRNHTGDKG